ncbi:nucleotidyltransferase family protein [Vibrio splendidus]|jgi:UDP-2-acetamido-4-(D-alanylamino)-2,4,6-trideoxy-alpha-D-mannopyranose hydrolase
MIKDIKNIILRTSVSIREALIAIDAGALRFAIVIDENLQLIGTITDGDIRRALIGGKELSETIETVFNSSPTSVEASAPDCEVKRILMECSLFAIPVVDNGEVVGLHTLSSVNKVEVKSNPVFIMAGGFGSRLRPLTDSCPKPMLKVGGKPMLEILIEQFKAQGFSQFFISTHYLPEVITQYFGDGSKRGVNIEYVYEDSPLGTGGALSLLPKDRIQDDVVVVNGDVLTTLDFSSLITKHKNLNSKATMCVREFNYKIPYGVVEINETKITGFVEKPTQTYQVNAGIYVISKEVIDSVEAGTKIDMPTLFEQNLNRAVNAIPFYDYWLDIGKMEDFEKAQKDILNLVF